MRQDGIFAAIWTPAGPDGSLLQQDLAFLIRFLKKHGVHGILALGSTGEFLHFTASQRKKIVERIVEHAEGLPVVVNVSHVNPHGAMDLAVHARIHGAAAISLLPPWFYPIEQIDLAAFILHVAEASGLPVLLYNFPELTGTRIELETISYLAGKIRLAGVKQSGSEFEYHGPLVQLAKQKGFPVFTGSDTCLLDALELGVTGCIGGLVNAVPELLVEVLHAWQSGHPEAARVPAARLRRLGECMDKVPFPLNVCAAMEARGLPTGTPKQILSARTEADRVALVGEIRGLFEEWHLR